MWGQNYNYYYYHAKDKKKKKERKEEKKEKKTKGIRRDMQIMRISLNEGGPYVK